MTPEEFKKYLTVDCQYMDVRFIDEDFYVAIKPFLFTFAIIIGVIGDEFGFEDRWCYTDYSKAKAALDAWNGEGEPTGWHRHPRSGRRVDENGKEYIAR